MARHGENIRKRKDGRWEGRYPVYSKEKRQNIYYSVYGKSYEEAREKVIMKKILQQKHSDKMAESSMERSAYKAQRYLFTDVADEWLSEIEIQKKLSTYVKYKQIYQNHLQKEFHRTEMSEITDALVREKIPDALSDSIHKSIYCVLNQVLKFASVRYSIAFPFIKRPVSNMRGKPVEVFTQAEQRRLLLVLYYEMDIYKLAVLLCLHAGLRLGELCALKRPDIDMNSGILTVDRTVQRLYTDGHGSKTILIETAPKSACSKRQIPLPYSILRLLSQSRADGEYIFGGDNAMEPRKMQYHFKKILREAKLPDKNFHILRHTFATNCIEEGTDVKSLSEVLGHSNVQITLNRYVHPTIETKRRHMDKLSTFYGQICGQKD